MKILTHAQALQVAAAMVVLNKLPAVAHIRILAGTDRIIHVREWMTDEVNVVVRNSAGDIIAEDGRPTEERYRDQMEFCACYQVPVPL